MSQTKKVTICACASRSFIDKEKVTEIAASLEREGYSVTILPDLCRKMMQASSDLPEIASSLIFACHPRAVRSHLNRLNQVADTIYDIRNNSCEEILSQLKIQSCNSNEQECIKETFQKEVETFPFENGTDAWYPVIDKERCTDCGKCMDFCLFGVYSLENGHVKVVKPENCKNNCPACARICPSRAIIFPKYDKSPINGGVIEEEQFAPDVMDAMYRERLKYKLQQRREGVSLLKKDQQ
ncbi:MAG: 4Fe-4S dicluster domain-containing protein [Bacteroidales bacterium]|nr:4Fe-4S dicluster domain-containing protein [Bacteroidales bacterium]